MTNVLITGGCGFIGTNLVKRLLEEGADVIVVDDMTTGDSQTLDGLCTIFHTSVNNKKFLNEFFEDTPLDIVYHLAARNIIASTKDPHSDFETNIGGTLNILEQCRKHNVGRVVYTSSASVYGNPKYLPINEDDGINLLTPYAVSKYAGEGYCMAFSESYNLPVTVLRLSNVYGPYQSPSNPYCGVVAKFMDAASKGEAINIHGDGLSTRDFTYVEDVVTALLLVGTHPRAVGEVFNVATGIETSVVELANSIAINYEIDAWKKDPESELDIELIHIDRRDVDNIRRRVLNIEKIRRKLGWMPEVTLERGLELTKKWHDALN